MQNFYEYDYEYDSSDGMQIAFGLTAYDSSSDQTPFDKSFGTLDAYQKVWGEKNEDGSVKDTYLKKIETRPCIEADINFKGVTGSDADSFMFFEPADEFQYDINRFYKVLNCMKEPFVLSGDYNTIAAKQLVIAFSICRGETYCRDEETEIKPWLRRKFVMALENQFSFNKEKVETEKLKKTSRLRWITLTPQIRTDIYNYVQISKLDLSDEIGSLAGEKVEHKMFTITQGNMRLYDFPDDIQLAITYELDRDQRTIRRQVYGILDFLGDIGGLAGALKALFAALIIIFQYKAAISYVSNRTFLMKNDEFKKSDVNSIHVHDNKTEENLDRIPIGFFGSLKLSFQRLFGCLCCK